MYKRLCASSSSIDFKIVPSDTFHFERILLRSGYRSVAGVDEAGRGPLAGPVVAACVILPAECEYAIFKDSKTLSAENRETLFARLYECGAKIGYSIVPPEEIDRINILQASLQAMALAVDEVTGQEGQGPDFLLVDGNFTAPCNLPQQALIKGDSISASIAAASIIAKVVRDRLMEEYGRKYPVYNFAGNKGYPTSDHRQALRRHGPCPIHRRSFKGVREFFPDQDEARSRRQQKLW